MIHRPSTTLVQELSHPSHCAPGVAHASELGGRQEAARLFPRDPALCDPQLDRGVSLGTTIIALSFDGGVVLAADSRTSTGTYVVNRVSNKLTKLTDNIYCCRSGSAADTQAIAEQVSRDLKLHTIETGADKPLVATAAALVKQQCYDRRFEISAGIIVAGFDKVHGGSVFNILVGGSSVKLDYAMGGSGSTYIYAWMDQNYKPGLTRDQCLSVAKNAVAHALSRDGSSGGVVRTICLDERGAEHSTTPWTAIPYCLEKDPAFQKLAKQNVGGTVAAPGAEDENLTDSSKF